MLNLPMLRRSLRRRAHAETDCPVVIVAGGRPPRRKGEGFYYQTKGGRLIHHPKAYAKTGWSNIVYVHSSRRVEVGIDYISKLFAVPADWAGIKTGSL